MHDQRTYDGTDTHEEEIEKLAEELGDEKQKKEKAVKSRGRRIAVTAHLVDDINRTLGTLSYDVQMRHLSFESIAAEGRRQFALFAAHQAPVAGTAAASAGALQFDEKRNITFASVYELRQKWGFQSPEFLGTPMTSNDDFAKIREAISKKEIVGKGNINLLGEQQWSIHFNFPVGQPSLMAAGKRGGMGNPFGMMRSGRTSGPKPFESPGNTMPCQTSPSPSQSPRSSLSSVSGELGESAGALMKRSGARLPQILHLDDSSDESD
jgi:hypothetical protein